MKKMKEKTKKRIRGSITILMVIILLPMMTMSAIIVDSSRINMARSMVSSAGDLAMNTALANYDTILKDVYGLFAMSQEQNMSDDELASSLKDYFCKTIVSYGVVNEAEAGNYVDALIGDFREIISNTDGIKASNFLDMYVADFKATKVSNSSLANPDIMRSQIVEYMKYRAPLKFGLSFLDSLKSFKGVQAQNDVVEKQVAAGESIQDVTKACQTAIQSIRDYDTLIESIRTGNKAVKGKAHRTDGVPVDIGEYHTQVDKYRTEWIGDNYEHANLFALVFFLKAPNADSYYLSGLNINSSQWFIKTDNTGLNSAGSGITVNPSLASATEEAEQQVYDQISVLGSGVASQIKSAYNATMLDYRLISGSAFSDEQKAMELFVNFENFLTDNGSLKYSDVKTTLESIYVLKEYYDNFYTKISNDIADAEAAKNEATADVNNDNRNATTYYNNIKNNVSSINSANEGFSDSYDFLGNIKNNDNEKLKTVVSGLLAETSASMPTGTKTVAGKTFTRFGDFVKNTYKESGSDSDNKYLKVYKEIINSSLKSQDAYKDICKAASDYLSDKANGRTNKTFSNYVKSKAGNASVNSDLFKLLDYLYRNSESVKTIETNITNYNRISDNYADDVQEAAEATEEYNEKVQKRNTVQADYRLCLSGYNSFVKHYQNDLSYYKKYIETAKSTVTDDVAAVNKQFTEIKTNVNLIITQLTTIGTNLASAKTAIEEYDKKVDEWSNANTSYANSNNSDSFSKQNDADIQTAKSQYNLESLETLKTYVGSIKREYQDFYNVITDDTYFKYGSKKIDTIDTADKLKSAVPSSVKNSLPTVVTPDAAMGKLRDLYNDDQTGAIEMDQWYFLKPVLPIAFLKYLNEAYPVAPATGSEAATTNENTKSDYESAKNKMKNDSGGEVGDSTNTNLFGYSYSGLSAFGNLPSQDKTAKGITNSKFKLSEDDGKVNVSDGFQSQSTNLGSILSGIGDIAEDALENTYILSYIFNNFSYNTLIQDMVVNGEGIQSTTAAAMLTEAKGLMAEETVKGYRDTSSTLSSNIKKTAKNNYLYGAEIEYILYGNSTAKTNVTYAKASIYAIRFAFNCIFAFTDSEIRTTTMAAGLAVQAATLGIVPYKIVQIILQLAMAAAESAIDLDMMNNGLKVAVVKTKDSWMLSLSSAVQSAGEIAAGTAAKAVGNVISKVSSGLQDLVDATASNINQSINNLSSDLETATAGKLREVVDSAFVVVQASIEEELNKLQYLDYPNRASATEKIESVFQNLENTMANKITSQFAGNPVADAILPTITGKISDVLSSTKGKLLQAVNEASPDSIGDKIVSEMTGIKQSLISTLTEQIKSCTVGIADQARDLTANVSGEIKSYIQDNADQLSEKATEEIKEKVSEATNKFTSEFLDSGSDAISNGLDGVGGKTSSSVASMFRFGYKDYLMLFTFIAICVNDDAILARTADVIQMNIQKATIANGAAFQHKLTGVENGPEFLMSNAKAYVSVHASVKLEMMFLNLDFFTRILADPNENEDEDDDTVVTGDMTPAATIVYNGLYGY